MKEKRLRTKNGILLFIVGVGFVTCTKTQQKLQNSTPMPAPTKMDNSRTITIDDTAAYQLIWADEFNGNGCFDTSNWQYSPRGTVAGINTLQPFRGTPPKMEATWCSEWTMRPSLETMSPIIQAGCNRPQNSI